jgi:hypothetical protein
MHGLAEAPGMIDPVELTEQTGSGVLSRLTGSRWRGVGTSAAHCITANWRGRRSAAGSRRGLKGKSMIGYPVLVLGRPIEIEEIPQETRF